VTKSVETVKLYRGSYFKVLWSVIVLLIMLAGGVGCDNTSNTTGLESIAGTAQLTTPDPTTGHTGILMFLAGTPFYARTDEQGRYRIDGIPIGTYDLVAEKAGFQTQIINGVTLDPGKHNADSPLNPPGAVLTAVMAPESTASQTNQPLGTIQGRVWLANMDENENGGIRVEVDGTGFVTVSSNNGQYRILNVDPGTYTLSYFKEGYRSYTSEEITVTTGVVAVEATALEPIQAGDVVSPAAAAAAAAVAAATTVSAEPPPGPNERRNIVGVVVARNAIGDPLTDYADVTVAINGTDLVAEINEQGQFRFDNLTSGTYTLIGAVAGGELTQLAVDLETQRTATVTLELGPRAGDAITSGTVRGRVVLIDSNGNILPDASGAQVAVNGTESIATTTADGRFELKGLAPGTYTLSASKDTFEPGEVSNVTVEGLTPVDVGDIELLMEVDRPRVILTEPADNARDVIVGFDLPISIKFSHKMNVGSVREAISLTPSTPFTAVMGNGAGSGASDDTMVIRLNNDSAQSPIQFGANYTVTIAETASNMDGVSMAEPYVLNFRTANPGIIQTSPEDGANRVYVDQIENPVLFTFNTRLDPDSINDRTIRVRPDGGVSVSVTHTNSDVTGWTTVRVATQWQPNTNYTVTVSRRVKAFNGQPLGNTPFQLKFRTAPMEIITMPALEVR